MYPASRTVTGSDAWSTISVASKRAYSAARRPSSLQAMRRSPTRRLQVPEVAFGPVIISGVLASSTVLSFETFVTAQDVRRRRGPSWADGPGVAGTALLGADIVEVAQVARSIATFGDRYLRRVFTDRELAYCTGEGRDAAPHLAARFAAKEATSKALRAGDAPLDWRWIEVVRRANGACDLLLHRGMRTLAKRRGVRAFRLSMSHDGAYAMAVVVG